MFKSVMDRVWAFDAEWVPCASTGRAVYDLPESMSEAEVMEEMWARGGATPDNPRPYLKTMLCRVVSIAAVLRERTADGARLRLFSLPRLGDSELDRSEASVVGRFLQGVGEKQPQLVGYNSHHADLTIFVQRALARGIQAPAFCKRPNKPWEGADYFNRNSDHNIDLQLVVGGWGGGRPSLHQAARACGIPGKLDVDGSEVASLWLADDLPRILAYNECDALTTYLLWLRCAHFGGFVTTEAYEEEQRHLQRLLEGLSSERADATHFRRFLDVWRPSWA